MTTTVELQNSSNVPALSGTPVYRAALVLTGDSQATATLSAAEVTNENEISIYYLAAGNTVLTPALMQYDLLVSTNPSSTTVEVPQNATFGWTFISGREPQCFFQRRGAGILAINFTGSAARIDDNDVAIETFGPYHRPVRLNGVAANQWVID